MCGDTQPTPAAPSAQVLAGTKFPSNSLGLPKANRPQQVNSVSLAPLAPLSCADHTPGPQGRSPSTPHDASELLPRSSVSSFRELYGRTQSPPRGAWKALTQECRPGHGAWAGQGRKDSDRWTCGPDRETALGKPLYRRVWPAAILCPQSSSHAWAGVTGRWGQRQCKCYVLWALVFSAQDLGDE